jgi:plastocyanin
MKSKDTKMKRLLSITLLSLACASGFAASPEEFTLTIKGHAFEPKELTIPAGKKIKLLVVNKDATPAEFESKQLGREKIIPGNSTGTINLGPLKPGRFSFVEEYHEKDAAAQGTLVVK